jgi:hypothetical protein
MVSPLRSVRVDSRPSEHEERAGRSHRVVALFPSYRRLIFLPGQLRPPWLGEAAEVGEFREVGAENRRKAEAVPVRSSSGEVPAGVARWRSTHMINACFDVCKVSGCGAARGTSGGSLILVPALALLLGTKEGVALAALLLATNSVVKVIANRGVIPLRASYIGARLVVAAPVALVTAAVIVSFGMALIAERRRRAVRSHRLRSQLSPKPSVLDVGRLVVGAQAGRVSVLTGRAARASVCENGFRRA